MPFLLPSQQRQSTEGMTRLVVRMCYKWSRKCCWWRMTRPPCCFINWCNDGSSRFSYMHTHAHTHTQPFYGPVDSVRDNPVSQNKHSPTHTYRGHQSFLICFVHLIRSMASSVFNPHAWQSFSMVFLQVFFGLALGLAPSTSYSIHFFT